VAPRVSAASVVVHAGGATTTYAGTFDAASLTDASSATLAGTYSGEFVGLGGTAVSVFSVDALGVVAGTTSNSCTYAGFALPASRDNVFDLTLTLGTGCANGGSTLHGHAVLSRKTVYAVAVSGDLGSVALFSGVKP
jgi:hypothetical protein